MPQRIDFLIPGDIRSLTGGYTYDRELAAALDARELHVEIRQLAEDLTHPRAQDTAARIVESLPDGALVVIDGLALAGLADLLVGQARRLNLVALVHHPAALETGLAPAVAARIDRHEHKALQAMRRIICTSPWTARQLADSGLAQARIRVVEPGIDPVIANACAPGRRRDPDVAHREGLRLICVASITPRKGHDILIDALSGLTDLQWQLECIGSRHRAREYAARLESRIAQHALANRVLMRGELDRDSLARSYARADLFVLASRLEGYGMVFAEAHATGLPIVATSGGATSETLAKSSARIVDDDALAATLRGLMADRVAWLEFAAAARVRADRLRSWQQVAAEFADAIDADARS
ncbi:MAG: glycosyltransferase family 4 protein [Gammaproteobacteria bacterium]